MEYTAGLAILPDGSVIRANRAQAYLSLKRYTDALDDCQFIVDRCPRDVTSKVRLRMGLALRALRRFEVRVVFCCPHIRTSTQHRYVCFIIIIRRNQKKTRITPRPRP